MRSRLLGGSSPISRVGVAAGGTLPVGAVQWLKDNPGAGFLPCQGQRFSKLTYPDLALKVPLAPGIPESSNAYNGANQTIAGIARAKSGPVAGRILGAAGSSQVFYTDSETGLGPYTTYFANSAGGWASAITLNGGCLCWGPNGFFISTRDGVYRSEQGTSWSLVLGISNMTLCLYNEISGLYVAFGQAGAIWTSPTGLSGSWTNNTQGGGVFFAACIAPNGSMQAVGSSGKNAYSLNGGLSWTSVTDVGTVSFGSVALFNGRCYAGIGDGSLYANTGIGTAFGSFRAPTQVFPGGVAAYINSMMVCGNFLVASAQAVFYVATDDYLNGWVQYPKSGNFGANFYGMCYSDDQLLAVGDSSVFARLPFRSVPVLAAGNVPDGTRLNPYIKAA